MSSESPQWWQQAARLWRRSARKRSLRKLEARIRKNRLPYWGAVTIENARRLVAIRAKYLPRVFRVDINFTFSHVINND